MIGELFVGELTINIFLQSYSTPILDFIFLIITQLGNPVLWFVISAWLFWLGKEKKSVLIATIILFNALIVGIIKVFVSRPRPSILQLEETTTNYSFPSGHSSTITAIYSFFEKKVKTKQKVLYIILVFLTALSRIYLGVHYVSDVIIGVLLGYLIGKLVLKLEKKIVKTELKITKINKEKIIIGLFLITIILTLILPDSMLLSLALLGYFTGYFAYKNLELKINLANNKILLLIGTIIFGLIGLSATKTEGILSGTLFFLGGIFITLIWPMICSKLKTKNNK